MTARLRGAGAQGMLRQRLREKPLQGRPQKHSLTLQGHRTSVSLEPEFWLAFQALARRKGLAMNTLAAHIDAGRGDQGLASAIRVAVLQDLQERLRAE